MGSSDDPHGGDDGPSAQVVALELQAGLPGPLRQQGHVATHDARAGARPQTADCRGKGGSGAGALVGAQGEGWGGRSPAAWDKQGAVGVQWEKPVRTQSQVWQPLAWVPAQAGDGP